MTNYISADEIIRAYELTKDLPREATFVHTTKDGREVELLVGYVRYAYDYVTSMREEAQ